MWSIHGFIDLSIYIDRGRKPTHGILNPYPWHVDPLTLIYWSPYIWYCDPPLYGISTTYPWYFDALPVLFWHRYPLHIDPWYVAPPYTWYVDPPTYCISNSLLSYHEPLSFGKTRDDQFTMRGFNIRQKSSLGSIYHITIDSGVKMPWGSKYHMTSFSLW